MSTTKWIKLTNLPCWIGTRDLQKLNDNTFICAKYSKQLFDAMNRDTRRIHHLKLYQYNLDTNKWREDSYIVKKHWKFALNFTIDQANGYIYIYTNDGKLYSIDSKSRKMQRLVKNLPAYWHPWTMLFIDGKIIVMAEALKGFVIDTKHHMRITQISRTGDFELTNYSPPLTSKYIESQNHILSIVTDPWNENTYIHVYSLNSNKIFEIDFRFRKNPHVTRRCSGYVLSKDQRYLIIFGGYEYRRRVRIKSDDIVLFDIKHNLLMQVEFKCPFRGGMQAILMNSEKRDELLVCGYIRQLWNSPKFQNMRFFPELLPLILQRICIEYVHILGRGDFRAHYKISIDDILNSIIVDLLM